MHMAGMAKLTDSLAISVRHSKAREKAFLTCKNPQHGRQRRLWLKDQLWLASRSLANRSHGFCFTTALQGKRHSAKRAPNIIQLISIHCLSATHRVEIVQDISIIKPSGLIFDCISFGKLLQILRVTLFPIPHPTAALISLPERIPSRTLREDSHMKLPSTGSHPWHVSVSTINSRLSRMSSGHDLSHRLPLKNLSCQGSNQRPSAYQTCTP